MSVTAVESSLQFSLEPDNQLVKGLEQSYEEKNGAKIARLCLHFLLSPREGKFSDFQNRILTALNPKNKENIHPQDAEYILDINDKIYKFMYTSLVKKKTKLPKDYITNLTAENAAKDLSTVEFFNALEKAYSPGFITEIKEWLLFPSRQKNCVYDEGTIKFQQRILGDVTSELSGLERFISPQDQAYIKDCCQRVELGIIKL